VGQSGAGGAGILKPFIIIFILFYFIKFYSILLKKTAPLISY
jgi:hypothetical protein